MLRRKPKPHRYGASRVVKHTNPLPIRSNIEQAVDIEKYMDGHLAKALIEELGTTLQTALIEKGDSDAEALIPILALAVELYRLNRNIEKLLERKKR